MRVDISSIKVPRDRREARKVDEIAESIKEVGLINPVTVVKTDGGFRLVAGLNRLKACKKLGWEQIDVHVMSLSEAQERLVEIDENLMRDDLPALERSRQMKERKRLYETLHPETVEGRDKESGKFTSEQKAAAGPGRGKKGAKKVKPDDTVSPGFSAAAAKESNRSQRTVQRYLKIADDLDETVAEVIADPARPANVLYDRTSDLLELSKLEPKEQRERLKQIEELPAVVLEKIEDGKVSLASALRKQEQAEKREDAGKTALVEGKFSVVYADPPWKYGASTVTGGADQHYALMPTKDICALPIKDRLTKNAALFLWVTNPLLPDGLEVLKAWGFDYKTNIVWIKDKATAGLGVYVRGKHELLLIATRGSFVPEKSGLPVSVIEYPAGRHSAKPKEVMDLIEKLYPGQRYLQLFAREAHDGWSVFGNEIQ